MMRPLGAACAAIALLSTVGCAGAAARAPLPADASPAEARAASLQADCRRAREQMGCYSEHLLGILEKDGVTQAMETLEALGERDRNVRRDGHMYAHAIGLAASPSPDLVGETFRNCRPSFQSGCYHGVIQTYFSSLAGDGGRVGSEAVNDLCADYRESEADRWLLFQCVHGMGHGLTAIHGHHLPSALADCDLLRDAWEREGCYGGVFMESIVEATVPHHAVGRPEGHDAGQGAGAEEADHSAHAGHGQMPAAAGGMTGMGGMDHGAHAAAGHGAHQAPASTMSHEPFPPLKRDDPLYPCNVLEDRYLPSCYQMQTSAILFFNGGDFEATLKACDTAPEAYRGACYLSFGRDVSGYTVQDHAAARRACSLGDPKYGAWCHIGYVKNLVDLTADPEDALTYCRGTSGEEVKVACYHAVGEEVWVLTSNREQGEKWCSMAEPAYREACRRGAGLASWREQEAE